MRLTGPNDARRVVWAIGTCFFFFFCIFSILTNVSRLYSTGYVIERAGMTKTGPNDAKRAVWTLGEVFFFSLRVFQILTNVLYLL